MMDRFIDRRDFLASSLATLSFGLSQSALANLATNKPLNFLVVGDWGRDGRAYQKDVAAQMAVEARNTDAQFVVSTGDNFYNLGVSSKNDGQWDRSFERIYSDEFLQRKWFPVLGNHDYGGAVTAQIQRTGMGCWHMPDRWYMVSGLEYGRPEVDLFFIDTPIWTGRETFPYKWLGSKITRKDQQLQTMWLTEKLLASTAPLKLVFGHYPIYSVGKHGGKSKMLELDRLFRRTGVTAYVCGHDHSLYHIRSEAMDYICSGGGSEELAAFTGVQPVPGCVIREHCPDDILKVGLPRSEHFAPKAGFASFSVGQNEITFKLIDRSGVELHRNTLLPRARDLKIKLDVEEEF